jgi:hypothetical protein
MVDIGRFLSVQGVSCRKKEQQACQPAIRSQAAAENCIPEANVAITSRYFAMSRGDGKEQPGPFGRSRQRHL